MQHVQVLPVQNATGAAGQPIMLQSQVIQTADGQTLIYQPVQVKASSFSGIFGKITTNL